MTKQLFLLLFCFFSLHTITSAQQTQKLFNGYSLEGWAITDLDGHGKVNISDSCVILEQGNDITGINWLNEFPRINYEVTLDAKRIVGKDFFCAITFPVYDSYCTFVIGGWGGSLVGLSSLDGYDAANNFTGKSRSFESDRWYPVRLKVTDTKVEAWIDNEKLIDLKVGEYRLSLRWEMELSVPFGIATYRTTGAIRNIKLKSITE